MSLKRISAEAILALKEGLPIIYWYKSDLKRFLKASITQPELLVRLDWDSQKRSIVESLVDHMVRHEAVYQDDLLRLLHEVSLMSDFSHLERLEDGGDKAKRAKEAVAKVATLYKTHRDLIIDRAKIEANRKAAQERMLQNKGVKDKLGEIKTEFVGLLQTAKPQERGYALEIILKNLFFLLMLRS